MAFMNARLSHKKKYGIFRPQGRLCLCLCVCVLSVPLNSLWRNVLTVSKYGYGNADTRVCCVGGFLDKQVVPLCLGGLQHWRGHVSALHGWQKHTHFLIHEACVVGDKHNDSEKPLVLCYTLCAWVQCTHAFYWLKHLGYQVIRCQPFNYFRKAQTLTEGDPLGSWLSLLESHQRGADALRARSLIKHGV